MKKLDTTLCDFISAILSSTFQSMGKNKTISVWFPSISESESVQYINGPTLYLLTSIKSGSFDAFTFFFPGATGPPLFQFSPIQLTNIVLRVFPVAFSFELFFRLLRNQFCSEAVENVTRHLDLFFSLLRFISFIVRRK